MALLTALSGWAIAVLVACTVVLPTLARGKLAFVGFRWTRRVVWLGAHYQVGFAIAGARLLHAFLAMSVGRLSTAALAGAGIWIASGGLLLVLVQVAVGGRLRAHGGRSYLLRRAHLLIAATLVAAGVVHVLLNGSGTSFPGIP